MAKNSYKFQSDIIVCGERAFIGGGDAIPMITGDYGQYDPAAQTFDLYPNSGNFGQTVYATTGLINTLVANGVLTGATGIPAGYPTPH